MAKKKYIIYSSGFDEKSGGVIALHLLCHLLNDMGEDASIWPFEKPVLGRIREAILRIMGFFRKETLKFATHPNFKTPIAKYADLNNAIVIYPEIISGNPLGANHIVRWFLHKPGYWTRETNFGENELYFFYNTQFNDKTINFDETNQLKTIYIMDDIYKQVNFASRTGSCYILRKGKDRAIVHDLNGSVLIDGLSHQETAHVFNNVKYCISYDTQTMLSKYAAMCGCISIVVPEQGISKEDWRPRERDRYGIAYGFDDLDWALATKDEVLVDFKEQVDMTNLQVKSFVQKCEKYFYT